MERFHRARGAKHALASVGLLKLAAEPEFGTAMHENIISSTGDEGRARHRTSEDPSDQANTYFNEHDRHVLRDPHNDAFVLPVGQGQSMNTKAAAARKLHGRRQFRNLEISIENRKGSVRHWYDVAAAKAGRTKMKWPYGYIRMSKGMDGDHVDCFIGPNEEASFVYVIMTRKAPDFKLEDEQKCMLGFNSAEEAKKVFQQHYNDKRFFKEMRIMPYEEFEKKVLATLHASVKKVASEDYRFTQHTDPGEQGDTPHQVINAHKGDTQVGWLTQHKGGDDGDYQWLKGMHINPKHRGAGAGRALLQHAIDQNPEQELRLRARPFKDKNLSREQLEAFYSKHGFKPYGDEGRMVRDATSKVATNVDDSDANRTNTGPTHNSTPGDYLGMPQSSLVGLRSIKGDSMAPDDKIDRMFRFHDDDTSTRVLDGNSASFPESPAV